MLVTVDRLGIPDNIHAAITDLVLLCRKAHEEFWVRLVIDPDGDFDSYLTFCKRARRNGAKILVEPIDSAYAKKFPGNEYRKYVIDILRHLTTPEAHEFDAVEVGNEINGDWWGAFPARKVAQAAQSVRQQYRGTPIAVTYYLDPWEPTEMSKTMAQWGAFDADIILVSHYDRECPQKVADWDSIFDGIRGLYPKARIGIGEFGPEAFYESGKAWPPATLEEKAALVAKYYSLAVATPGFERWGGYWDFVSDCAYNGGTLLPHIKNVIKIS